MARASDIIHCLTKLEHQTRAYYYVYFETRAFKARASKSYYYYGFEARVFMARASKYYYYFGFEA
jgi:hypothetical protein